MPVLKLLKLGGLGIVALILVLVLVSFLLPSTFEVERSVVIQADPEMIHALVGDLSRWDEWAPWKEEDPTIVVTFGPATMGVGASQLWTGESGEGELTFTEWNPEKGIAYDLAFDQGAYLSTGRISYHPLDGATKVTWSMAGAVGLNPIDRYFALMMDSMVGPMFERGLARLKHAAEAQAAAAQAAAAGSPSSRGVSRRAARCRPPVGCPPPA